MKKQTKNETLFITDEQKKFEDKNFEECFKRLEEIVGLMEEGNVSLEESIKLYEEGIVLAKICMNKLNNAELKIKKLSKDLDGKFNLEDFDLDE